MIVAGNLPDKSVDLDGVDVVELLEGLLDLGLVGLDIDDEDEGVVLLDLLHGALGVERVDDDLVLIQTGLMGNRLAEVLGRARESEGLGAVEGRRGANLVLLVRVVLRRPLAFREVEIFMGVDHHISISTLSLLTYASEGSLSSSIGLLQTLRRLGGTACVEKKNASAIALESELAKSALLDASARKTRAEAAPIPTNNHRVGNFCRRRLETLFMVVVVVMMMMMYLSSQEPWDPL